MKATNENSFQDFIAEIQATLEEDQKSMQRWLASIKQVIEASDVHHLTALQDLRKTLARAAIHDLAANYERILTLVNKVVPESERETLIKMFKEKRDLTITGFLAACHIENL